MTSVQLRRRGLPERMSGVGLALVTVSAMAQILFGIYSALGSISGPTGAGSPLPWTLTGVVIGGALLLAGRIVGSAASEPDYQPKADEPEAAVAEKTAA